MRLQHGLHLAYCTNIHRGESWEETFQNLKQHTLAVRQKVAPDEPYAIGLRLGQEAAKDLSQPQNLTAFKAWLEKKQLLRFHDQRISIWQISWHARQGGCLSPRLDDTGKTDLYKFTI